MAQGMTALPAWDKVFRTDSIKIDDKIGFYDSNANTYDEAMLVDEYRGPRMIAELIDGYFKDKKNASILCIPAGTGAEITELKKLGNYSNITALDASQPMLDILKEKKLGTKYVCKMFHDKCGMEHDQYDAVTSVGGFVPKHLQCDALDEMCNVCKPGGLVIIMCREAYLYESEDYNHGKFHDTIDRIEREGRWKKITSEVVQGYYGKLTGAKFVYRKC